MKILEKGNCIGFMVLQRRNDKCKVLFAYYKGDQVKKIQNVIFLHCYRQKTKEILCYDQLLVAQFLKSKLFLYVRKKERESIISKKFDVKDFSKKDMNFGDGDCSFA